MYCSSTQNVQVILCCLSNDLLLYSNKKVHVVFYDEV
jgi:hypothetical protein